MSTPPPHPTEIPLPKFDNTLGALLIGGLMSMALWGVTCTQTYTFLSRSAREPWLKGAIDSFLQMVSLWVLDTFGAALTFHVLYFYLVTNYLNPLAIAKPTWSAIISVAITNISAFLIRTMFTRRFYRLSKGNLVVTIGIVMVSTTALVCGLVIVAKAFKVATFLGLEKLLAPIYLHFATSVASDFSITVALIWLLVKQRTGFRRTDNLISTLIVYTVNTGLIVSIDLACVMITYAVMPRNFIFLGFYFNTSKLYLNAYLATMNSRDDIRTDAEEPVSIRLSQISSSLWRSTRSDSTRTGAPVKTLETAPQKGTHSKAASDTAIVISVDTLIEKSPGA